MSAAGQGLRGIAPGFGLVYCCCCCCCCCCYSSSEVSWYGLERSIRSWRLRQLVILLLPQRGFGMQRTPCGKLWCSVPRPMQVLRVSARRILCSRWLPEPPQRLQDLGLPTRASFKKLNKKANHRPHGNKQLGKEGRRPRNLCNSALLDRS